jgi:sec-independent protein translocase protein TatB
MFDIGFPELLIVSIVALLVIGPEKLPETVRSIALWVGRIRRSLANIKMELENEIGADEIRRQLRNEAIMERLNETKDQLKGIADETEGTLSDLKRSATLNEEDQPAALDTEGETEHDGTKQSESGR